MAASNPSTPQEVQNQQLLEREIRSMISTLTGHLTGQKAVGGVAGEEEDDAGGGMRIVTLAGTNKGAMMEGTGMDGDDSHGVIYGDDGQLSAFANSNYQAVNNSIMLGGSCTAGDPGVHLVVTEYVDDDDDDGTDQLENPVKEDSDHVEKEKKKTTGQEEERN